MIPTRDQYYLDLARAASRRSKDPSTQVGAILVGPDESFTQTGYNGLPKGVPDDQRILADRTKKLLGVIHAEKNAVLRARRDITGATIYVWPLPPCAPCAAFLIQAGVTRIVARTPSNEQLNRWREDFEFALWMYGKSGVTLDLL